jgi:hypothetical protein
MGIYAPQDFDTTPLFVRTIELGIHAARATGRAAAGCVKSYIGAVNASYPPSDDETETTTW